VTTDSGFVETNGGRIYYEVDGDGEPVVLIHAGIANLRMWDGQVPALADRYRVIRYDTRGFGRTETEDVPFSNRDDITAVLAHLGESSAHVVGISRAGSIALDYAIESPDRVRSLTFVNGGIGGYEAPGGDDAMFAQAEKWWESKDWEPLAEWETDFWVEGAGQSRGRVAPEIREQVHDWILSTYRAEKAEGEPQRLDPPAVGRLGELRAPLLVIIGTLDEPGTQAACRHLAATVPGARLEELEAAHMVNLEHPERFNALLRDWLDSNATAGAEPSRRGLRDAR
jgi:3-oxoadipate enol-lactonase